jgi:WD40 repeat protein
VIAQDLGPSEGIVAWNSDFTRKATSKGQRVALPGDISIKTEREKIAAIAWSPDSTRIAALSVKQDATKFTIEIWDAQSGDRITAIQSGEISGFDSALYWSNNGTRLAHSLRVGDKQEYTLHVYDAVTGDIALTYDTPQWYAPKVACAIEILTGVIFLDAQNGELVGEQIPMGFISALAWRLDGDWLAIGGADGVIRVWDVSSIQRN